MVKLSAFGEKLATGAGILSLMEDLGQAMAQDNAILMGGGNPGFIAEIESVMAQRLRVLADDPRLLRRLIGIYDPPQGDIEFRSALATLLRREYGWELTADHIALTNGSQSAFFLLFNLFAGTTAEGGQRRILLPMAPEYIGYADLGLVGDFFTSVRPRIELIGEHQFKYRVDFSRIQLSDAIGAICVSRPTNPTGNVLTDHEVAELARLAGAQDIPLILDSAYGAPFPNMLYTPITPFWDERILLCLSLSKFGLPAVRTGIVIGRPEWVRLLAGVNAVVNLATGSFGAMLTTAMIESGEILRLSREVVQPFYRRRMEQTMACLAREFAGLNYRVHVPEGAMFLWLWFPELPISCRELYQRLKRQGVIVVAGDYFFPGLPPGWHHMEQCLRITYAQGEEEISRGLAIIAREIRSLDR